MYNRISFSHKTMYKPHMLSKRSYISLSSPPPAEDTGWYLYQISTKGKTLQDITDQGLESLLNEDKVSVLAWGNSAKIQWCLKCHWVVFLGGNTLLADFMMVKRKVMYWFLLFDPVGEDYGIVFVCYLLGVLTLMLWPNSYELIQ